MPEGQFTGSRNDFEYISDSGTIYKLELDETNASIAALGLALSTPPSTAINKPTGFKPRVVFWQGLLGGVLKRKELVCNPTSTAYQSDVAVAITVDGVDGVTTGRRGGKLSF